MTYTPTRLVQGSQLSTTVAAYYTVGSGEKATISQMTLTNVTASPVTVTVYLVPSGNTAGDRSTLSKVHSIPAYGTWICYDAIGHTLSTGEQIQAFASAAASVTMMVSGVVIS